MTAALYNDSSRGTIFAERARKYGYLSGSDTCQIDLLEWSPGDIIAAQPVIETNAKALPSRVQPRIQVVFAPLCVANHRTGAGIQAIFDHYSIPSDFISQSIENVTHSFGGTCDASSYSSWFHFLCKNVTVHSVPGQPSRIADPRGTELSQGDWTWIRTSVFMRWSNCVDKDRATVNLVIFSASLELRDRIQRLWNSDISNALVDPFSLFVICLDELWMQAMGIVRIVGDEFSNMERTALDYALATATESDANRHDFVGLHNMAKHIIYLKEGADAAALTMAHLQNFHQALLKQPPQGQDAMPVMRLTSQMLAQKAVQFEVWKLRMASLEQRMQNIINLSFNVVTQHDSHTLKNDSKSMKAIASVTMAFLPLATIAAVFGSQFFNFDSQNHRILVANDFWIFWALIGPLSLAVSSLYYYLCYFRAPKRDPLSKVLRLKHLLNS